jgi:hypothetical protein
MGRIRDMVRLREGSKANELRFIAIVTAVSIRSILTYVAIDRISLVGEPDCKQVMRSLVSHARSAVLADSLRFHIHSARYAIVKYK